MRIGNRRKNLIILAATIIGSLIVVITQVYRAGPEEIGVWFYSKDFPNMQTSIVDRLIQRNINTIYFAAPDDRTGWNDPVKSSQYVSFIEYARSKGMKVYAVTLEDPLFVLMTDRELNATFGGFISKTKHLFDTYIIDVEPHAIDILYPDHDPPYKGNEKYYLQKYVQMSRVLRNIADKHEVKYIDTIPPYYHANMKEVGIAGGINALSSHDINVMAYAGTIEDILDSTSKMRADSSKRLVISINVTPESPDPALAKDEIPRALRTLKQESLSIGIWSAQNVVSLDARLFQV